MNNKNFNKIYNGTKEPSLKAMKYFIDEYDNFQVKMNFIHIAGTNGKGSCSELISEILIYQGYKVGKFISPHLVRYNERITINKKEITDEEIKKLMIELTPKVDNYNFNNETKITPFELETIMALIYFYRNNTDFVVLETGLGGLYDCTNIISSPLISVITSIGYDHMDILGANLTDIAYQKAGIIKENSNTVYFEQTMDIDKVFIDEANKKNNKLTLINKNQIKNYRFKEDYQYFDFDIYKNIMISMKGKKQVQNAAISIECIKILNELGYYISESNLKKGLKTAVQKGRMEILNKDPLILFDGAHNEPAIFNFIDMVNMYYKDKKRVYIISILKSKDYKKIIQILMKDLNSEFIFTSGNNREIYVSNKELYDISLKYKENQNISKKSLTSAIKYVMQKKDNSVNFFVGSFYIYSDVVNIIKKTFFKA